MMLFGASQADEKGLRSPTEDRLSGSREGKGT